MIYRSVSCFNNKLGHLIRTLYIRKLSSESLKKCSYYHELQTRSLIIVEGNESSNLLQGLITNDMKLFSKNDADIPVKSIYSMMLNPKGRVLYDVLIYSSDKITSSKDCFLVECDRDLSANVLKHLNMFKMRKKLSIRFCDELKVWSVFQEPSEHLFDENSTLQSNETSQALEQVTDLSPFCKDEGNYLLTKDPRVSALGYRLVLDTNKSPLDLLQIPNLVKADEEAYQMLRYRLGVSEGGVEHPPTECLPLECNVDFMSGVDFHKGCYLGQELTARTHYTGMIRKRLLPLCFPSKLELNTAGVNIVDEEGKSVGKLRGLFGKYGLALLWVAPCLKARKPIFWQKPESERVPVTTYKPYWWSEDAFKIDDVVLRR